MYAPLVDGSMPYMSGSACTGCCMPAIQPYGAAIALGDAMYDVGMTVGCACCCVGDAWSMSDTLLDMANPSCSSASSMSVDERRTDLWAAERGETADADLLASMGGD